MIVLYSPIELSLLFWELINLMHQYFIRCNILVKCALIKLTYLNFIRCNILVSGSNKQIFTREVVGGSMSIIKKNVSMQMLATILNYDHIYTKIIC